MLQKNGWNADGIYDTFKTTEFILQGTLPANSRWLFQVNTATLKTNERADLSALFARVSVVADNKDAKVRDAVLFTPLAASPLVEPVRRHNVIRQVHFVLENFSGADVILDMTNPTDDTGQELPDGLLVYLGGELAAPLWASGQARKASPAVASTPAGFTVKSRANQSLIFDARLIGV